MHEQQKQQAARDERRNMPGGTDTVGHSGVQAWSAGEVFPFVIAFHEYYSGAGAFQGAQWVVSGPTIPTGVNFAGYAAARQYAAFKRAQLDRIKAEQQGRNLAAAAVFAAGCTAVYAEQDHQAMRPAALAPVRHYSATDWLDAYRVPEHQGCTLGEDEVPPRADSGDAMARRPEYNEPLRDWQGVITWIVGHVPLASRERDVWARLWLVTKPMEEGVSRLEAYTRYAIYLRDHGTWRTVRAFKAECREQLHVFDALRTIQCLEGLI